MPDICDIHLRVRGPAADLEDFKAAVLKDTEPMPEDSPFRDQFIFTLRTETWGDPGDAHTFLWLKSLEHHECQTILGTYRPACDEVVLIGEAKWGPPTAFVERAMEKFPTLDFDLHGTTEHAFYEHWQSTPAVMGRRLVCREERVTDISRDTVAYLRIDGQVIFDDRTGSPEASNADRQGKVLNGERALKGETGSVHSKGEMTCS